MAAARAPVNPARLGQARSRERRGNAEARRSLAGGLTHSPDAATQPTRFELLNVQTILLRPSKAVAVTCQESPLIIPGVILLIIVFITGIAILWTIGIIALVAGVILALLGMAGHAVGGRRHYLAAGRNRAWRLMPEGVPWPA